MSVDRNARRPASESPWRVPVKDLVHSAGIQRTLRHTWPAPEQVGTPVLGVVAGEPVDVDLRLEAVHEGVLVTGTADLTLTGECSRCLDPIEAGHTADLQELFLAEPSPEDDEDQHLIVHETIDLEPVLRDAVVTALPFQPVCRPDCGGLCADCGVRLEDVPAGHAHERLDPRWAALADLVDREKTSTPETEER